MYYEKDYGKTRFAFVNQGRIEDPNSGSFEVIGQINLSNCLDKECADCEKGAKCFKFSTNELVQRVLGFYGKVEIYSFEGEEPLKAMDFIKAFTEEKEMKAQKLKLKTNAPIKYWIKNNETLKNFQTIVIKRNSVDDFSNNQIIGEEVLTKEMYLSMEEDLRNKIVFLVDCQKAKLSEGRDVLEFLQFAEDVKINEIVFDFGEEVDRKKFCEESNKEMRRMKACIEKVRRGEKLHNGMIHPVGNKVKLPLITKVRNFLIANGWNFDIIKSISQEDAFFSKVVLKKGKRRIALKQKIAKDGDQKQMWQISRSHKYVIEL